MAADATGQPIFIMDLVMFQTTDGEHHDRGLVLKALPGKRTSVLCVDATLVAKKNCDLTVVDRAILWPGMPVLSASDRSGQAGVITSVTTMVDLVDGPEHKVVATGVSPAEVYQVRELILGDYVVSGTWLGRVIEVSVDIDVLFDDTSICRVTQAGDKLRILLKDKEYRCTLENNFIPGDRVSGDASVFKASRWLRGHWKPSRCEGTVAKVDLGGVLVYWVASLHVESAPPAAYQPNPRDLSFFCSGDPDHMWFWLVSARCFFRSQHRHTCAPKKVCWRGFNKRMRRADRRRRLPEFERPMAVADTHTTVDVLWQDGTRQQGVPSASIVHVKVQNQQDFLPGQRVIAKDVVAHGGDKVAGQVGVVKSLSYKDQTVCVSWITGSPGESSREVDHTVMSTYDLRRSSDHKFFYGDVVVRQSPRESAVETGGATVQTINDLSWVGHIVDQCDTEYIHIKWGDGNTSKVLLSEVAVIKIRRFEEMLQEMGDWVHDEDGDDAIDTDGGEDGHVGATTAIGHVGNIIKQVIATASGISLMLSQVKRLQPSRSNDANTQGAVLAAALASHDSGDDVFHFQHFDVVQSPQDHHYLDNKEQGNGSPREWLKRVQKEWKILETNLPDTIYVRAFDDRMDLLRAVMVGVSGTPYEDGLFFFDMKLSPTYPNTPPQLKYHSFGLRVNPNLYPSGTVCLSLLGTYGGEGPELWSPDKSSILQVVVSIQGLVLTERPYYNEAGFAAQVGTPEGHRNELPYCENTYLVNLQTMLHLIRRPPAGFQAFVMDHFRRRGQRILQACEAYIKEGCAVGTLDGEASTEQPLCSTGFRLALANVVPRLIEAFTRIGAQGCHEFHHITAVV